MKFKTIIKQLGAACMMAWILLVSCGFVFNVHYCNDEWQSIGVYTDAEPCEMAQQAVEYEKACCERNTKTSDQIQLKKADCCKDKQVLAQLEIDRKIQTSIEVNEDVNASFLYTWLTVFSTLGQMPVQDKLVANYSPPLLSRDVVLSTQCFLL